MPKIDLVTPYKEYFRIIAATTDELRDRVFSLRYEVYCQELGWEDASAFPDRREIDHFDAESIHCLLHHRRSGRDAGTVRLVRARADCAEPCMPLVEHYEPNLFFSAHNPLAMPRGGFGEISRLALHEQFRRRPGEQSTPDGHGTDLFQWTQDDRRRFPHMALGLYLAAATIGLSEGMDGVYAMMEPRLARHLHFGGIFFEQVGEPIEFRGARAPFYISREMLFEHLTPPLRALLEAIAEDLEVAL
ncbi:PEP-CTERM/exosortase system-associated acyltransferase [Marichromatium bheemlicum]|uniref:PEP-CTERM/exosortase system-associated acyltransferase n=1 Tax=Marichromatium bheemlicum TaxID=365339 RepID=A0ABX1I7W7_9GAMM|nr:PEP-CTERM/exosortase system-associated acyltransferase [Marichromatium bheemlicum]NKN33363.1 PEP-CTERM/exosortase system-associated acyltransferase [Marichromatium bheemlicum]